MNPIEMPTDGDDVVDLPETNKLFKHHLSIHGLSFIEQLGNDALGDAELETDSTVQPALRLLADAVGTMLAPELRELSLFHIGLSRNAINCFAKFVIRIDKFGRVNGKVPGMSSLEESTYESYDDDFEEMSSPEKSDSAVSTDLAGDSPTKGKPPMAATAAAPRQAVKRRSNSPSRARDREWISKGSWTIGEKIGCGSFGEVFKGLNNHDGKIFAVKRLRITAERSEELLNLANEVDLMRNMSHPNIVSYIGTKVDVEKEVVYIFQEWVSGGSVHSMLDNFGPFQLDVVRTYTSQILLGLQYLHENGIVHRDIKGGNILVENSGSVKLADFGASAKVAMGDTQETTAIRGTPYFSPPENLYEVKYGRKGDIWAVGCTVVEMLTGKPPWESKSVTTVVQLYMHIVATKGPPPMSREVPDDADDFLVSIFKIDPKERPSAIELQMHPFLSPDNYEDSMETSSYGGSSVGSNIYGSSSVDLLRLREVEVKKRINKMVSESPIVDSPVSQQAVSQSTASNPSYRQKAGQKGLKAETAQCSTTENRPPVFYAVGSRVEARFAGLAKWLSGTIRKRHDDRKDCFDVEYDNGKVELKVAGSLIRYQDGHIAENGAYRESPRSEASPGGNPFARQISPVGGVSNSFGRPPISPLPSVLKTPTPSPDRNAGPQPTVVVPTWDSPYKSDSTELPSPFKSSSQKELASPILSTKCRGTRTAPGVSRDPDNVELFPEGVMAKKESRRDVRTAGNISDAVKEKRTTEGSERRKGSRRAAGRVARAVSENTMSLETTRNRVSNRIGPAQILRDARSSTVAKKGSDSLSSLTFADDDDSLPTIYSVNLSDPDLENRLLVGRRGDLKKK